LAEDAKVTHIGSTTCPATQTAGTSGDELTNWRRAVTAEVSDAGRIPRGSARQVRDPDRQTTRRVAETPTLPPPQRTPIE
jgi:hypothetical protein